jgi:hypothetical protein
MTVTNGSRFPVLTPGQYFYATIIATNGIVEIVKVNTRNGNAMSITRAQDGTNAQAFASGARVEMRINAASVRDTATDTVAPIDARLTTAEGDITALEGRMTTAEGDITALENFDTALATSTGSASVGFLQAGSGASLRTVQSKLRDVVSVKDFGAAGNGISDDTAAFAAALATGKGVYIPPGTYLITSSLTVSTSGQSIFGCGFGQSIVQRGNDNSFIMFNVTAPWGVEFLNFKIQEAGLSSTNTGSYIQCSVGGGTDVLIQGMWFWYGWQHVRCMQGTSNITFSNSVFEAARKGAIYSISSVRNKIIGCTFWKNSADSSNPSDRGYAINFTKDGAYSFGSDNWNIVGNYFAENVYGPFLLADTSEGLQITGNFFEIASQVDNGQKSDIELSNCTLISITGNTSNSIVNSYLPGGRGSKYVVDLSGGGNTEIVIGSNEFEAGVSGTVNDPSRVADPIGSYSISWSMPVQVNSSGTGVVMSSQLGQVTRVGKTIHLSAQTVLTNKGASVGAVRLGPLPYTPSATGLSFGSGYLTNTSGITTPIYFFFNSDGYVYPLHAVATNVLNTNIANNTAVYFSGTYQIA